MSDVRETGLAARLREGTQASHQRAEGSSFVGELMAGNLSTGALALFARQLRVVYGALESAADGLAGDPVFGQFHDPALRRVPALEADLRALAGPSWHDVRVLPATVAYATRLTAVGHRVPALVAHHYTRYLGDLSGGQAIGSILARQLGVAPGDPGVSFYHFVDIAKVKPYKDSYRLRLDALALTPDERDEAVAEAVVAFELNTAMFRELLAADQDVAEERIA